jgi:hypothetical protein
MIAGVNWQSCFAIYSTLLKVLPKRTLPVSCIVI